MKIFFAITLIIFLPLFLISLFRKKIEISWPWVWENIGKHFVTRYLLVTENRLILCYLGVVTTISANNLLSWILGVSIESDKSIKNINLEVGNNCFDTITFLIILLPTIVIIVKLILSYRLQKVKPSKEKDKTLIVLYGARIVEDNPLLNYKSACQAISSDFQPSDGSPFCIQMNEVINCKKDWEKASKDLEDKVKNNLLPFLRTAGVNHISLFGIAPMPLLVKLGVLLNEKYSVDVFQKHRNPDNWLMLEEETGSFIVNRPKDQTKPPVLVLSLSDRIIERITRYYENGASIWEVTVEKPNMDMMRTKKQQEEYKRIIRDLLNEISRISDSPFINVHMAIPASCAIELGRAWMPKPHKSLVLYDYRNNKENEVLTIKDNQYDYDNRTI